MGWTRAVQAAVDAVDGELAAARSARPCDPARVAAALLGAIETAREYPQTAQFLDLPGLWDELAEVHERAGRVDEALAAVREAIAAGLACTPDPRCRLAEIALRAGQAGPAGDLFAAVKAETPDDVWLYNNAGIEYVHAGHYERALAWLDEGTELALATGDPERLLEQLLDFRRTALRALGRDPADDELDARAQAFLTDPPPLPARTWSPPAPAEGLDATAAAPAFGRRSVGLAFGWFPASEFVAALAAWPGLAESWGTAEHGAYNRMLQGHMTRMDAARGAEGVTGPLWVAPIHLDAYRGWCAERGEDPGSGATRAAYAAEAARVRADGLIPWPPPRNGPCWCSSGRKYKKCCGNPAVALAAPPGEDPR